MRFATGAHRIAPDYSGKPDFRSVVVRKGGRCGRKRQPTFPEVAKFSSL
jgi:hypothetical protein